MLSFLATLLGGFFQKQLCVCFFVVVRGLFFFLSLCQILNHTGKMSVSVLESQCESEMTRRSLQREANSGASVRERPHDRENCLSEFESAGPILRSEVAFFCRFPYRRPGEWTLPRNARVSCPFASAAAAALEERGS